mmetsp:Transcript_149348/g.416269  ORF Transcript_149348/g.416269 Transcript_149348/m.416269 type:complete len:234 (-) Transcript_149348:231-932(-)
MGAKAAAQPLPALATFALLSRPLPQPLLCLHSSALHSYPAAPVPVQAVLTLPSLGPIGNTLRSASTPPLGCQLLCSSTPFTPASMSMQMSSKTASCGNTSRTASRTSPAPRHTGLPLSVSSRSCGQRLSTATSPKSLTAFPSMSNTSSFSCPLSGVRSDTSLKGMYSSRSEGSVDAVPPRSCRPHRLIHRISNCISSVPRSRMYITLESVSRNCRKFLRCSPRGSMFCITEST